MDLFYMLKENFKNLLFDILITEKIFENWSYLSSCSLFKDVFPEEYAQMYYVGRLQIHFTVWKLMAPINR